MGRLDNFDLFFVASRVNWSHHWQVQPGGTVQQGRLCQGGHFQGQVGSPLHTSQKLTYSMCRPCVQRS